MALPTVGEPSPTRTIRKNNGKAKVLFTNAYGPYPMKWGRSPSDLLGARLARDNNMDGRIRLHTWPLYVLAENISCPSTVIECPNWDDFIKEVKKSYDVIAIQLLSMHMARVVKMMKAIREMSPETEIVIGGYGVGMLHEPLPGDKEGYAKYIKENADHICRGEGVRFMRELLDDQPIDRPITQYDVPPAEVQITRFENHFKLSMPAILVSLGCPNACEFCNTSAFFHHKKIRVSTAQQVYDTMKSHQRRLNQERIIFILFDEDIFLDPEFVRELGRLIRSDRKTWGFRWISFGSMSTASKFSARELRECGVMAIWVGVESGLLEEDNKSKTGYLKREAAINPEQFFRELASYDIGVIGSMILGFDFHTPENIEKDIDYFVDLKPLLYQVGPFRPCPGTKLYDRLIQEERVNEVFNWEDIHLWEVGSFKLKNITDDDLRKYFELAHYKLRSINGPPLMQLFECAIQGYQTMKDSDSEFLRYAAEQCQEWMLRLRLVIKAVVTTTPYPLVKARAKKLLEQSEPLLPQDFFTPFRKRFGKVAPRFVTPLQIVCTYQNEETTLEQAKYAPETRWTRYNAGLNKKPRSRKRMNHPEIILDRSDTPRAKDVMITGASPSTASGPAPGAMNGRQAA